MATMIGSFLGFFLGLIATAIKEKLDFERRVLMFKAAAIYLARGLKTYIHEDPSQCQGLDIKVVNSCLDGASRSPALGEIYELLFSFYMDWARGSFSPQGLKVAEIPLVRDKLDVVIAQLRAR